MPVDIRHRSADCVLATCGPVLLMFWVVGGPGTAVKTAHRLSVELGRAYPAGIAHLNLISKGTPTSGISQESRDGILALLRDPNVPLLAAALVLPGQGFVSALVRSILSGATMLARSKATFRFVSTAREAETFLRTPGPIGDVLKLRQGMLVEAVEEVRATLDAEGVTF